MRPVFIGQTRPRMYPGMRLSMSYLIVILVSIGALAACGGDLKKALAFTQPLAVLKLGVKGRAFPLLAVGRDSAIYGGAGGHIIVDDSLRSRRPTA